MRLIDFGSYLVPYKVTSTKLRTIWLKIYTGSVIANVCLVVDDDVNDECSETREQKKKDISSTMCYWFK